MKDSEPRLLVFGSVSEMLGKKGVAEKDFDTRCSLMTAIAEYIEISKMTQKQVAQILEVDQPRVSDLVRGKISKFSLGTLIEFLWKMDFDVSVKFTAPKQAKTEKKSAASVKNARVVGKKSTRKTEQLELA